MMEHAEYLLEDPKEILRRHHLLKDLCQKHEVSIPLLKMVEKVDADVNGKIFFEKAGAAKLKKLVKKYNIPGKSYYERLMEVLKCSEDEFIRILLKNPRLGGKIGNMGIIPKIELLVKNGVDVEKIKNNSSILKNQSYDVLETRLKQLKNLNMNFPINLNTLNRTEKVFQKIYNDLANKESATTNQKSFNILSRLPMKINEKALHFQKKKVDMLLKKGFDEIEIVEQASNLNLSYHHLKSLVNFSESLKPPGTPQAPLKLVLTGENNPPPEFSNLLFIKSLNTLLDCTSIDRLPDKINKKNIESNIHFLIKQHFSKEHLSSMPFVLCYPPEYVKLAWEDMVTDSRVDFRAASQCGAGESHLDANRHDKALTDEHKVTLLNVLQYKLEMLPISEVLGGSHQDHVSTSVSCLTSDDVRASTPSDIYDVEGGSEFRSEEPVDFYEGDDEQDDKAAQENNESDGDRKAVENDGSIIDAG